MSCLRVVVDGGGDAAPIATRELPPPSGGEGEAGGESGGGGDVVARLLEAEQSEGVLDEQLAILLDNYEYVCGQFDEYERSRARKEALATRRASVASRRPADLPSPIAEEGEGETRPRA